MSERKGTKGLELWCRKLTEGYPNVKIENMTTSWRDGLAFCAIIHRIRPELIDFNKLNKDDIYHNNELAFRIAEQYLGIPALLEPEDMVDYPVPDRLSILTYMSQFYKAYGGLLGSPGRMAPKRSPTTPDLDLVSSASGSPPAKVFHSAGKIKRDPCAKCDLPVYIAERLNVGKLLYHRTCFRCARCDSQLALDNYYETEENQYCCEVCPDEDKPQEKSVLSRSMSDEEKRANLKGIERSDDYSTKFETALEFPDDANLRKTFTISGHSKARIDFFESQLKPEEEPPDLPQSLPPKTVGDISELEGSSSAKSSFPEIDVVNSSDKSRVSDELTDNVTKDGGSVKNRLKFFEGEDNKETEPSVLPSEVELSDSKSMDESFSESQVVVIEDSPVKVQEQEPSVIVIDDSQEKASKSGDSFLSTEEYLTKSFQEASASPSSGNKVLYPDDLNPFGDDEEEDGVSEDKSIAQVSSTSPVPSVRKKIPTPKISIPVETPEQPTPKPRTRIVKEIEASYNPFEEDEEEEESVEVVRKVVQAPKISLNPFGSDEEDEEPDMQPRASEESNSGARWNQSLSDVSAALTSSSASISSGSKKKKPAPKPPGLGPDSALNSLNSTPCHSTTNSPKLTPKHRKNRKAPLPPSTSTPFREETAKPFEPSEEFEQEKFVKDEMNRTKQSKTIPASPSSSENSSSLSAPNKSTYGKWKRRKGQAPPRPVPPIRRTIKSLPINEVRRELDLIEIQQQGLEKQGVKLEQMIREKCEGVDVDPEAEPEAEVEDLILQLFEIVNEKNELFRKQAELMYLRRQLRLEEEHAEVEYQIRCLMIQPEANKTDSDKAKEEELINRLVEIVERRNEIIESLEMDRVREKQEDSSIKNQMTLYTQKREEKNYSSESSGKSPKKEKKKKDKKFKLVLPHKKEQKVDADKDVDEAEVKATLEKKKKKKFNIF